MSERSKIRRLCRSLIALYEDIDRTMADAQVHYNSPCSSGCAHCCFQLPSMSLAEGLLIADFFFRKKVTGVTKKALFSKNKEHVDFIMKRKYTLAKWWQMQIPCVFLTDENTCRVYEVRPSVCRSQMVTRGSDCSYGDGKIKMVQVVNPRAMTNATFQVCTEISNELRLPLGHAPFPVALLWAFAVHNLGRDQFARSIKGTIFTDDTKALEHWRKTLRLKDEDLPSVELE